MVANTGMLGVFNPYQNKNPRPTDFTFQSPLDQSTWQMDPRIHMNTAPGWEQSMLEKQKLEQQKLSQTMKGQVGSGIAQAQNRLAMRGGLSSGARERTSMAGQRGLMGGQAQVGLAGAQSRADIGTQAQNIGMAEQQFNIQNILTQNQLANQAALEKYKTQMEGWAGKEQAEAQRAAGGGGGK